MVSDLVVIVTNGGEGEYIVSRDKAEDFKDLLLGLGYTAEIEELSKERERSLIEDEISPF